MSSGFNKWLRLGAKEMGRHLKFLWREGMSSSKSEKNGLHRVKRLVYFSFLFLFATNQPTNVFFLSEARKINMPSHISPFSFAA